MRMKGSPECGLVLAELDALLLYSGAQSMEIFPQILLWIRARLGYPAGKG